MISPLPFPVVRYSSWNASSVDLAAGLKASSSSSTR